MLSALLACALPGAARADIPEDAQPIRIGEADAFVNLRTDYVRTDNRFLVPDDPESASGVIVQPSLSIRADRRTVRAEASYDGAIARYDEEALDFDDHDAGLALTAGLTSRLLATARLGFRRDHERFGTTLAVGGVERREDELVSSDTTSLELGTRYGAENARFYLSAGLLTSSREWDRGERIDSSSDRTLLRPSLGISYRISPDTRATFDVYYGVYDYDNDAADRDIVSAFVGLGFSATGKLRGSLRVGASDERFDEDDREGESRLLIDTRLSYLASDISRWNLDLARTIDSQNASTADFGAGSQEVVNEAVLGWRYQWSSRFSHNAYVEGELVERGCPGLDTTVLGAGLDLDLSIRRWLSVGVGVDADNRRGEDCADAAVDGSELDYERLQVGAHVNVTL